MRTRIAAGTDWIDAKNCPVCGREFHLLYPKAWGYKRSTGKKILYFCSWNCMREEEKERDEMKKLTLEQKKTAVTIAVDGGNPLDFLEGIGIKNAAEAWSKIKAHLKEFDPDTYAQLPKRLPQRVRTVSASAVQKAVNQKPENVVLVEDPSIAEEYRAEQKAKEEGTLADAIQGMTEAANKFFGTCEDMGLKMETPETPKIVKPLTYDGYTVCCIESKTFGRFYWDRDHNHLDWTTGEGEEVSFTPQGWKMFLEELPKVAKILGVEL